MISNNYNIQNNFKGINCELKFSQVSNCSQVHVLICCKTQPGGIGVPAVPATCITGNSNS